MARIAQFRRILKDDFSKRIKYFYREAVTHILAEQAACGQQVTASPDPSAY